MNNLNSPFVFLLVLWLVGFSPSLAAQVSINESGAAANSKSMLDISSSTKGLLVPRMTTAQKTTFASGLGTTEKGMMVYDTDMGKYYFWDGSSFTDIKSGVLDKLVDTNGDSEIRLTTSVGSDVVEVQLQDTNYFRFQQGGLEMLNNGQSVFIGEIAGASDDHSDNNNVFIGYSAGWSSSSGSQNVAVGALGLSNNSTGYNNIALGYSSLYKNTSGFFNIGIGHNSLYNNQTASGNMAIGYYSLYSLTVGIENNVVGNNALQNLVNGYYNSAFGYMAGFNITGGSSNTLIGFEAGYGSSPHSKSGNVFLGYKAGYYETGSNKLYIENSNSTTPLIGGDFSTDRVDINGTLKITGGSPGANKYLISDASGNASWSSIGLNTINDVITDDTSVFIGYLAGNADDGGNYNVGIGRKALENSSTANRNTAVGVLALNTNTIGADNVAIGHSANSLNQTGSQNTIVGCLAGKGSSLHSKSGNVFLGYMAGYDETASNKLYIENSNSSTPLIGGDFAADEVYINGTIKITGGSPGSGKILTSDANGTASWQANAAATELNELSDAVSDGSSLFVGNMAGNTDDGANNNVAVGINAMSSNTSGFYNAALGSQALFKNAGGAYNSGFGYQVLYNNTAGIDNTAVGANALFTNTANYNSAFGFQTLFANSSGLGNSAFGLQALKKNTTGDYLASVGYQSLYSNTTGDYSVAFGKSALYNNTTGSNNVAIGYEAGNYGTANSNCTYIGYQTRNTSTTDYTNSTALGNQAIISADNQVRIGNSSVSSIGGYVAWTNVSDRRFKSNISDDVPGLNFIMRLRPVNYNLDIEKINQFLGIEVADNEAARAKAQHLQSGFIAQEVEQAANEIAYDFSGIDKPKNSNDHYGLRYSEFVVPLVKAVQELNNKNDLLQKENEELKLRLAKIEQKLNIQN
ncbi:MAG: hypothetical protein GXO88_11125 [Chlorobi bacterium]|nr:hypothetical protein [Chlorobiota bacterium]